MSAVDWMKNQHHQSQLNWAPRNRLRPHIIAVLLLSVIVLRQFAVVHSSWGCCHSCFDFITLQSVFVFGLSHLLMAVVDNDIQIVNMGPVPLSTPSNVLCIYFLYLLFFSPIEIESKTTAGNMGGKRQHALHWISQLKTAHDGIFHGASLSSGSKCHLIGKYWFSNSHLLPSNHQSEAVPESWWGFPSIDLD